MTRLGSGTGVVFTVLDLANPIFDLLLAVDVVNWLADWLLRDRIAEKKEWAITESCADGTIIVIIMNLWNCRFSVTREND